MVSLLKKKTPFRTFNFKSAHQNRLLTQKSRITGHPHSESWLNVCVCVTGCVFDNFSVSCLNFEGGLL